MVVSDPLTSRENKAEAARAENSINVTENSLVSPSHYIDVISNVVCR